MVPGRYHHVLVHCTVLGQLTNTGNPTPWLTQCMVLSMLTCVDCTEIAQCCHSSECALMHWFLFVSRVVCVLCSAQRAVVCSVCTEHSSRRTGCGAALCSKGYMWVPPRQGSACTDRLRQATVTCCACFFPACLDRQTQAAAQPRCFTGAKLAAPAMALQPRAQLHVVGRALGACLTSSRHLWVLACHGLGHDCLEINCKASWLSFGPGSSCWVNVLTGSSCICLQPSATACCPGHEPA